MTLPVLVDAQTLHNYLSLHPNALIIDLCSAENYTQGHIPGSTNIVPSKLSSGIKPATGSLPDVDDLKAVLEAVGLTPNKQVIVYDDAGGSWAGRMMWTLELIGHTRNTLLDGGMQAWRNAGLPVSQDVPEIRHSTLAPLHYNPALIATKEEILAHLDDKHFVVWDARSPEEYNGSKLVSERGGHIPGAINLDWVNLFNTEKDTRLLPLETLQALLDKAGLTSDKTIATHCQTHRRSGLTWFVAAKLLGYQNIKAYPGSWAEWGNNADLPIEK